MVSSPAPDEGALVIGNHRGAVRRANTLETAAVFWNGSKIQRRFRERIKRLISIADPAGNGVTRADTKPQARPG
jgi:hypothetical protein